MRLNATHYFIMKVHRKRELQQVASDHPSDIDLRISQVFTKIILKNHFHIYLTIQIYHQVIH